MPENSENQQEPQKQEKFDPKVPPDKSNPDDIYKFVAKRISGPSFRNPLKNFIDENCMTFIDVDENTFEQGELFKELNQLLENLLDEVLTDGQLTQEDFLQAAEKGISDPKYKKYFNQVINFGDYNFFKSIMTKRNYQIIKMAEQQMANAQKMAEERQEQNKEEENLDNEQKTKELVAKLLEEEKKEYDEAIKQSLAEEDRRRRIAAIEEEELRRALKNSLMVSEKQKEQKDEPEIKKEEPKKSEPKKIVPNVISAVSNFQFEGISKPENKEKEKENPKPEIKPKPEPEIKKNNPPPQNKFVLQSSTSSSIQIDSNPYSQPQAQPIKQPEPEIQPKIEIKKEEIKPKEEPKNEIKPEIEEKNEILIPKEEEPKEDIKDDNIDLKPKKEERITRDFINVFDEKKRTLKPLGNKTNISNNNNINKGPNKPSLLQDLQKKKTNIKDDIERIQRKNEKQKNETALDIIKQTIAKDKKNNNDIVNLEDDDGGLLINDDNEEDEKKNEYVSKHKIEFGKIEIPNNFNGKIPEYTKEKQEELKDYRNMVIKNKINERQNDFDDEI